MFLESKVRTAHLLKDKTPQLSRKFLNYLQEPVILAGDHMFWEREPLFSEVIKYFRRESHVLGGDHLLLEQDNLF